MPHQIATAAVPRVCGTVTYCNQIDNPRVLAVLISRIVKAYQCADDSHPLCRLIDTYHSDKTILSVAANMVNVMVNMTDDATIIDGVDTPYYMVEAGNPRGINHAGVNYMELSGCTREDITVMDVHLVDDDALSAASVVAATRARQVAHY